MNTFLRRLRHTSLTAVLSLFSAGAFALLAGRAAAAADETFLVDPNAGTDTRGALFRVDAISGDRSLVSDFGNATQGPLGFDPFGVALEADGTVLVIDQNAGTDVRGALFRVDAISGNRSLVSDFGNATQGPTGLNTSGLSLEADGTVLVIDQDAGPSRAGALFRVDAASGARSLVSDFGKAAQGSVGEDPLALALEPAGTVLIIDDDAGTGFQRRTFPGGRG